MTALADPTAKQGVPKFVVGLGNPGPRYDGTRHNVGWWVLDRVAFDHDFGPFERSGPLLGTVGAVGGRTIALVKPSTYMNRSGLAVAALDTPESFEAARDLLVVADDANLDVGRVRLRARGGAGGHNGLRSVTGALGTSEYARLRVGVGTVPPGGDLSEWVLSAMTAEDEKVIVDLLPTLAEAVVAWAEVGVESAMNRFNR